MVEITAAEQNIGKRMKENEDSLRGLNTPILTLQGSQKDKREKGPEKIFEDIRAKNFPNMGKETVNQVQGAQRAPGRMNPRRNAWSHIVIKLTKIKDKDKLLKATREKRQGNSFLNRKLYKPEGNGMTYLK